MDIDELVAHSSSSIRHWSTSFPIRCCAWEESVRSWKDKIQWYSDTNFISELNRLDGKADGVRVEKSPRIHNSGYPQRDSQKDGRITV